jgi:hypothetical protein
MLVHNEVGDTNDDCYTCDLYSEVPNIYYAFYDITFEVYGKALILSLQSCHFANKSQYF